MKYIAVFDVPDGYGIGCASAKMAERGKEIYYDEDFSDIYAQVEPLSEEKTEILDKFNTVNRIMQELGVWCAYDMPSFWTKGNDYKVIQTKWHKGYMQALNDVEKEIRKRFGFANRDDNVISHVFNAERKESD